MWTKPYSNWPRLFPGNFWMIYDHSAHQTHTQLFQAAFWNSSFYVANIWSSQSPHLIFTDVEVLTNHSLPPSKVTICDFERRDFLNQSSRSAERRSITYLDQSEAATKAKLRGKLWKDLMCRTLIINVNQKSDSYKLSFQLFIFQALNRKETRHTD